MADKSANPISQDVGYDNPPADARYCPSCGESLDVDSVEFKADSVLNVYRCEFSCPECGYHGEVFRL